MKQVKRWRYYCDYCKKSKGTKQSMERHEKGCTARSDRHCGMCDAAGQVQGDLSILTGIIETECKDFTEYELYGGQKVNEVLAHLENEIDCPACVLAAIRQAKIKIQPTFNFKKKAEAWWAEVNANREPEYYY